MNFEINPEITIKVIPKEKNDDNLEKKTIDKEEDYD